MLSKDDFTVDQDFIEVGDVRGYRHGIPGRVAYYWRDEEISERLYDESVLGFVTLNREDFTMDRDRIEIQTYGGKPFTVPGEVRYYWRDRKVSLELFQELLGLLTEEDAA